MTQVEAIIIDVDGTLTDGKLHLSGNGELFKSFDVKDGYAIKHILPAHGIVPVVMTGRESAIVSLRCQELGVEHVFQGSVDKIVTMESIANILHISENDGKYNIAYIGDDLIDLPCMKKSKLVGCPADAANEVKQVSDFISCRCGGDGAVREFIEWIIHRSLSNR